MAKRRTIKKQIDILIGFIEQNPEIIQIAKSPQDAGLKMKKWENLKNILNAENGPEKNIKEWKNVFNDLKTNVRRKARLMKNEVTETGGGSQKIKNLSDTEQKLLQLLSPVVIDGLPDLNEPGIANTSNSNIDIIGNMHEEVQETEDTGKILDSPMGREIEEPEIESSPQTFQNASVSHKNIRHTFNNKATNKVIRNTHSRRNVNHTTTDNAFLKELIQSNQSIAAAINNVAAAITSLK